MANARIRAFPIYVASKKIAEMSSGSMDVASNDERQVTIEGYYGHSDGQTLTDMEFTTVTPVRGHEQDLKGILLRKEYVQVGALVDGALQQITGRIISFGYSTDAKSGKCEGKFKFEGGEPQIT
jgi:hypothetical protein